MNAQWSGVSNHYLGDVMATSMSLAEPPATPSQEILSDQLVLAGYMRREELAQRLGVSPRTIDRWQTLRCGPPRVKRVTANGFRAIWQN
jgi:hypothetical protein